MSDALYSGQRFRTFDVVDDFNREAFAVEVDINLPATRVIRVFERITPGAVIRPRFAWTMARNWQLALADWAEEHGVELDFIQPGRPLKIHTSSVSTGPIGKGCSLFTYSHA